MLRCCVFVFTAFAVTTSLLGCESKDSEPSKPVTAERVAISPPATGVIPAPSDVAAPPESAVRTESGLACVVLREGWGTYHPSMYDTVSMHQVVWTPDGKMHMNTGNRGQAVAFDVTRSVLPGLREAIQLMVEGEKRRCWIPGELAFGVDVEGAPQDGRPRGTLVYELDLVEVQKAEGLPAAPDDLASIPEDAERSESGLAWRVLREGTHDKKPTPASTISMSYTAWTPDGQVYTSTAKQGTPRSTTLGGVIPGLREGLLMMRLGEKRRLWIPPELAYRGQPGRPQGILVYDVELVAIMP